MCQVQKKIPHVYHWSFPAKLFVCLARGNVKGTVAVINRAAVAVGIEFDDTASILTDSDTDEGGVLLSLSSAKAVAITVFDFAGFRVASEVSLALELAWGTPAVTLNGKLATVTSVVARCMVIGEAMVVDSFTRIVDDGEARVMAVRIATRRPGDG